MTNKIIRGGTALIGALLLCNDCVAKDKLLWKVYSRDFEIGAAVAERYVLNSKADDSRLALKCLKRDFNCATSENLMKPASLRPAPGEFNFDRADQFVRMARKLDLEVVGHVLVWHSQTPNWFFEHEDGSPLTRDELIERMREHIYTVVKHYKGHVKYWDVVNEAVDVRGGQGFFRESKWQQIIGDDFIELAFQFAHEADPDAILIYNDYSMTDPAKVDFVAEHIVRNLKKKGIRIDAVGMQAHWHVDSPSLNQIEASIETLTDAGVKVHITELDMSVLPSAWGYTDADVNTSYELQDKLNPYQDGLPEDMAEKQAERYRAVFELFEKHRRDIERVTFWGISDGDSWKNNFPMRGRTDYPLLFDRNFEPKPVYNALVKKR